MEKRRLKPRKVADKKAIVIEVLEEMCHTSEPPVELDSEKKDKLNRY
jgi:hypothetical protein